MRCHESLTAKACFCKLRQPEPSLGCFAFCVDGKTFEHGLGAYPAVSLAAARDLADEKRKLLKAGVRPLSEREKKQEARVAASSQTGENTTFRQAAFAYIEAHSSRWTNPKHPNQWKNTLETYAFPSIGDVAVSKLTAVQIADLLRPIWTTKVETATRVRMRIKRILDWCEAYGYRTGANPGRWIGSLEALLRAQPDVTEHHAALPYKRIGAFVGALRGMDGIGPRALEFNILTATRAGEAVRAKWDEFNFDDEDGPTWTVPKDRIKSRRSHRIPLSKRAVQVVKSMAPLRDKHGFVFPSPVNSGEPLTDAALLKLVKELSGDKNLTTHGTVRLGLPIGQQSRPTSRRAS